MNDTILVLFLAGFAALIVLISLNNFSTYISCDTGTREGFVDKYYHWDWNDPQMLTLVNLINNTSNCKDCTYSMSCDFTDDVQPFCHRSLDVPSYDKKNRELRNNSI